MSKQPSYKAIFSLAIPALFGGIVEPLLSLTDIAIVGNMPDMEAYGSLEAVAALGVAGSLVSALLWIFAQTKSAISAIVSRQLGANNLNSVATLIPQMIALNLAMGLFALAATYFSANWVFTHLFQTSDIIGAVATDYYKIRAFGFPITLITFSLFGVFRGLQNTYWAMLISISGALLNVALDFAFVFGLGELIQPMGIEGAAYASLIAQLLMLVLSIFFLLRSKLKLFISRSYNMYFRELLLISANLIVRTLVLNVTLIFTHRFANIYGDVQAATHAVLLNLWLFSAFFLDAFATAANALGGKFLGAKNIHALHETRKKNMFLGLSVSIALSIVVLIFDDEIMHLLIKDQRVVDYYPLVLPIFALCLPVNALAFVMDGIFKGMGEAKYLRNLLIISTFIGFLPSLFILNYFHPSIQSIWISIVVWMIFRGLLPYFYFNKFMRTL